MSTVYEELDDAKAEIEKLRADYRIKLELSESLKRVHNEQLIKFQEASLKVDKLCQELNEKAEEISLAKQIYEEVKSNLKEKEAVIKHLTCANDKLRADCKEKLKSSEEENRELALALDEARATNMELEQQIRSLKEEIEGLKGIVSVSQNKCSEADRKSRAFREGKQREDVLLELEEEKIKYENQLKWKKEQFGHLEDAHKRLRHQFQVSEREWEREKASLIDEISRLQANLDSQTRMSESLQSRLQMCNQALAHEESKRKLLELQLSESKTHFDNVFADYEEAKSTIESLTGQRDNEIASLRNSLGTRESLFKEMEYQVRMLEQEKQELLASLKELQEAQIRGGGSYSSLTKLRNKLRGLEQVHKDCSARLNSKEAEWHSQLEILMEKLNCCSSELESKNSLIDQLKIEAEAHDAMTLQLALHNEEATLMLLVLKSGYLEAQMKLAHAYADLDNKTKESKENVSLLRGLEQVHKGCSARLKSKEAEWHSQLEFLMEKLNCCSSELESKNALIDQLKIKAEAHDSMTLQLALRNEEATLMLLVLKSGYLEAQMKLAHAYADIDNNTKESKESVSLFRGLEQVHKGCSARLNSKEAEWKSQMETLVEKHNCCSAELENKNILILQLKRDSEAHDSLIELLALHNEESALLVLVLKSGLLEAHRKLADVYADLDNTNMERKESQALLLMQLEMKNSALIKAQKDTEEERKKVASLSVKVESANFTEEQHVLQRKELERLENMLIESYTCQSESKKQVLSMNSELIELCNALNTANEELDETVCRRIQCEFELHIRKSFTEQLITNLEENHQMHGEVEASLHAQVLRLKSDLKKVHKTLDRANEELAERFCEVNEAEFELQIWKSIAEQLKASLEENHQMRKEVEASLLAEVAIEMNLKQEKEGFLNQLEEKEKRIDELHEQVSLLNQELGTRERTNATPARTRNAEFSSSEQRTTLRNANHESEDAQEEEDWVKKELEGAILAQVDAEENYEHEKESLHHLVEEREERIEHLQQLVKSLEQEFESSTSSFSSRLSEMQVEINLFREAWQRITTSVVLKEIEIQEKNLIILEMENDMTDLETELQLNKSEMHRLRGDLEKELCQSDLMIEQLNDAKGKIIEDVVKLSSDRENLLDTLGELSDRIHMLSTEDVKLMESLRSIMQNFDSANEHFDPVKENRTLFASPRTAKAEAIVDERLPLRALNNQ